MKRVTPALALCTLLVVAMPSQAADRLALRDSYGTKATYEAEQGARTYQRPPAGFTPVFTENVSRHGSRSATDGEDGDLILGLWHKAQAAGELTGRGKEFGPKVQDLALTGAEPDWFLLIWLPLFSGLLLLAPRLQARVVLKIAARNGTYRATVTDAGLTMVTDNSTTSVNWVAQPRYRETKDAFFTFSDDKNATCFTVLPKRGLQNPADGDRLREILDRNLTRV